jgi:hypothetical protein
MKKRIFKYIIFKILVIILGLLMLFISSFTLFEIISKFRNYANTFVEIFLLSFVGSIFILDLFSLILVIINHSKSILLLNIYYIYFLIVLIFGFLGNYMSKDIFTNLNYFIINFILIILSSVMIFLINRFKYKEIRYENIDSIGTQND